MSATPGPWRSAPTGKKMRGYSQPFGIAHVPTLAKDATLVAGVFGDVTGGIEVAEANARLISAAPDMRDALALTQRTATGSFADGWTVLLTGHEMEAIRAAIAKAEAKS